MAILERAARQKRASRRDRADGVRERLQTATRPDGRVRIYGTGRLHGRG